MKRWYVVQVFAGYEEVAKADMLRRIQEESLGQFFGEILIPAAKMKQFFDAGDALQDQQLFPGYMLIEMESVQEAIRLVTTTPRVLRFLGGKDPVALSKREIDRILAQIRGEVVVTGEKRQFEIGKEVEIAAGPFAGFVGIVDSVEEAGEKLTVMVSIFGRMTPVELGFDQVKH